MKTSNVNKSKYIGILYIIAAAFCFAFMNLFVKLAGDLPAIQKSFFRNLVAVFFAFGIMKKQHIPFAIPQGTFPYLFARSFFGTLGVFANFYAIGKLCIADASMLNKLSPFFAIIFSFFLLKERIKPYQLCCVITAFVGALFILRPGFDNVATFPALLGLFGGMMAGLAYTNVRLASLHGAPGPLIVLFFSVFSCASAIPFMIYDFQPMSRMQLISLLLAGLSATGGQFSITAAYSYAPASEISVYDYTQIIFAALLGMIFLGEMPDVISVIGYVVICGAGVVMFLIRRRQDAMEAAARQPVAESGDEIYMMHMSGAYLPQNFFPDSGVVLDCRDIDGTNCYCDDAAKEMLRERIKDCDYQGIHFLDSGNYHYLSLLWMEKIQRPFSLVLFDHHPDLQQSSWGKITSCGGWVREALEQNRWLQSVYLVGVDEQLLAELYEADFVAREDIADGGDVSLVKKNTENSCDETCNDRNIWKRVQTGLPDFTRVNEPLYLSFDKDVLCGEDACCDWDQGTMTLTEALELLERIFTEGDVLGMDVCGEDSQWERAAATATGQMDGGTTASRICRVNESTNAQLLALWQHKKRK